MPDFLHSCIAAMVAARPARTRLSLVGGGRGAIARLGVALALILIVFGALDWEASGANLGPQMAQLQVQMR